MMRVHWRIALALAVAGTLGLAACAPAEDQQQDGQQQPFEETTPGAEEATPGAEEETPGTGQQDVEADISVDGPVDVADNQVTIGSVQSPGQGWVVIHADDNGEPGEVLGQAQVAQGVNTGVVVDLDRQPEGDTLWAMLHEDAGEMGTFEFPDGDPPVTQDGQPVQTRFEVSNSM